MKAYDFFTKHSVFTRGEFDTWLKGRDREVCWRGSGIIQSTIDKGFQRTDKPRSQRTVDAILRYHVKRGNLVRIKRGVYAVVPLGFQPDGYPVNAYLVAGKLAPDSVLAYHTALEFHGLACTTHRRILFLTEKGVRNLEFAGMEYRAVKHPTALQRAGKKYLGVQSQDVSGLPVDVTNLERTFVDVLDRPDLAGGFEEVYRCLDNLEYLGLDEVVEYSLALQNATTIAKVGYFLAHHKNPRFHDGAKLKKLHGNIPKKPHYLDRTAKGRQRFIKEWNLMVPEYVIEKGWQENEDIEGKAY